VYGGPPVGHPRRVSTLSPSLRGRPSLTSLLDLPRCTKAATAFALLFCAHPVEAREDDRKPQHGADCQLCSEGASGLELAVPLWLPLVGLDGDSGQSDGSAQHIEFDAELKFAIVAQVRLRLGPIGIETTINGGTLGTYPVFAEDDTELGELDLAAYFGRIALYWHTSPISLGSTKKASLLAIWPYAGGRYALFSGEGANADQTLFLEGTRSWAEPLIGVQTMLDLRHGWLFVLGGDVGGFTIGSDISAWLTARTQYALTDWLNLWLGWIFYYTRFPLDQGGKAELVLQGPGAGLGVPLF
jgi:hypothetical protein